LTDITPDPRDDIGPPKEPKAGVEFQQVNTSLLHLICAEFIAGAALYAAAVAGMPLAADQDAEATKGASENELKTDEEIDEQVCIDEGTADRPSTLSDGHRDRSSRKEVTLNEKWRPFIVALCVFFVWSGVRGMLRAH
jgi:hypothetical protein